MNITKMSPAKSDTEKQVKTETLRFHKLIPNLMTLTALAAGLTAIQLSMHGKWESAVIAIVIAGVLDAMDGATARLLKAQSDFGAQLDSFSDFLAFGVAPSLLLYSWVLEEAGKIGWIAMLVFSAAMALRLSRFNVTKREEMPEWKRGFFSGVPAPGGAGLALLPLFIWLQSPDLFGNLNFATPLIGLWVIFVAALMVSRIPTFSTKQIHLPTKMAMPALALGALAIAALIQAPWQTLTITSMVYLASIPLAIRHFLKLKKEHADDEDITDIALGASTNFNPLPTDDKDV